MVDHSRLLIMILQDKHYVLTVRKLCHSEMKKELVNKFIDIVTTKASIMFFFQNLLF
jgi:hypothetical protein